MQKRLTPPGKVSTKSAARLANPKRKGREKFFRILTLGVNRKGTTAISGPRPIFPKMRKLKGGDPEKGGIGEKRLAEIIS